MKKADLHAHSTLQPYGQTFRERKTKKSQRQTSIWYYYPPKGWTKWLERIFGISSFSQANFTSSVKGDVRIMGVSLYSPEISFFQNKLPRFFGNGLENIITRYSKDRIYEIESGVYDYFADLEEQYKFLVDAMNENPPKGIKGFSFIQSVKDVEDNESTTSGSDLKVFLNVEGGHCLGCGYPNFFQNPLTERQKEKILKNIETLKKWEYPVLYFTLAHHFYNQLTGHCKSLPESVDKICDQSYGMDFPITDFGFTVIDRLLNNIGERRILIDIKHMSTSARQHYIEYLEELKEQKNQYIPIIYSHGGANGRATYGTYPDDSSDKRLNPDDLGLFDVEILAIADSNGLMGLNMDQRVMASKDYMSKLIKRTLVTFPGKRKYLWAGVIWNNIRYIAELLDANEYCPWDYISLGTDFDGAINPVNYFVQEKDMEEFSKWLKVHAEEFLLSPECKLRLKNQISANEIIDRIFYKNAQRFIRENLPG